MAFVQLGFIVLLLALVTNADPPGPGWQLVLEDTFDKWNPSLWTKGWSYYKNGIPQPPVNVKGTDTCYFADENVYIQDGHLVLRDQREQSHGYSYTSGVVNSIAYNSSQGFEQLYGYFETRFIGSLGGVEGMCPAFWLPNVLNYHDDIGEIDIIEVPGGKCCGLGARAYFTVHKNISVIDSGFTALAHGYWGDDYHVYALLWQPNMLCWYIDNVKQFCTDRFVPTTPSFMVFDNEIGLAGESWGGYPDASTPFPQDMKIDYVRVWKQT